MKKLLFSLAIVVMPFLLSAQLMDTTVIFYENFDGDIIKMTTSANFGELANWRRDSILFVSSPASYHTPSYPTASPSFCTTRAIEVNRSFPYVYLEFDQICKVNNNDRSYILYQQSTSVSAQGDIQWGSWVTMNNYTTESPYYHGHAEVINAGNVSQNWYTIWQKNNNAAVPQNTWWKKELFDMSQFVVGTDNQYFRIRFQTMHASGTGSGTEVCAGWYIDNLKLIYSNVELVPPTIKLLPTVYVGTVNNNTGPFVIKTRITDNDTVNLQSLVFWYHTSEGVTDTIVNTITQNYFNGGIGDHIVEAEWTIPMQCYGTSVDYHIYVEDTHGSCMKLDTSFFLQTTQSLAVNDGKMESFQELPIYPDRMVTGQSYPIKVVFRNKGLATEANPNHMTSATFGWSVNGVDKPVASWTGDLCLDYTDTIIVGNHVALRDSNYIKVWLISRNGVTNLDRRTDDTIKYDGYACDSALSGTYTLGGPGADFPTVRFMKERFYRCGFDGPVTINMNAGTYTGFDFDDQYPGLDSTNTITFQAAPGVSRSAVIIANAGNNPPVKFTEMAYVTIRNVTIRNTNVGRCVDFVGRYSHDITIDNCDIQGTTSSATPYYNSSAIGRITAPPTSGGGIADYNMTFTNNTISNVNFGLYFTGATSNNITYKENNFMVRGNTINATVTGINAIHSRIWTIDGNIINQQATSSDMNFVGIAIKNGADFQSVSANSIKMNQRGGTGLSFDTYANSTGVTSIMTVANNEIINKATVTGRYNILIQNSKQMNLAHNSSYVYSLENITQSAPLYVTGASSSTKEINIYNNVFVNASTSLENKNYAIYLNYTSASALANTIKLNNNEYYSVGNSLGWFVAPRNNFEEWQSAMSPRGDDTTSISIPLTFVSPTDSLVPSQFEGLECLPLSYVTTDIRGTNRYNTITFMGCYTRAIPAIDLAMVELTSPVLGNECPATHYPIKVRIKNTGSAIINFANQPATIHYTIGTTTGSANVNTGTIAPLQTKEVQVIANFSVSTNMVYDYSFDIHINGDNNSQNDSLTGSFEIQAAFPYFEETFSTNVLYPSWRFEQISTTGAGNWTVELGAGTFPAIAPNYGLGRLFFNSKVFANNTESRAIMPVTILQDAVTPILEYWFAHDNVNSPTEGVTVKISTNGGMTYDAVNSVDTAGVSTQLVKRYKQAYTTPGWAKYMVDLAPYSNQNCIYIAFDAKSNAKNNINIDRVVVRNFYNNDLAVNDIWTLGANPTQHEVSPKVYANISNEGRLEQTNFQVMLEITGANTYRDTITVPSLDSRRSMTVSFNGVHLNNPGDNVVRVYCASDMNADNNEQTWQMTTTTNEVAYANDSVVNGQHFTYSTIGVGGTGNIAYVNKYEVVDTLIATHVKAFITNTAANLNVGRHFRFIVTDASGNIIESSDEITVTAAMENQWVTGEIHNFALTSTNTFLYVGIEMLDGGTYLGVQEEAPLRSNAYYKLVNGSLTAATDGRLMIAAVVDSYMSHELALLSLVHPLTDCDLGHENIVVKLTNNGTDSLQAGTPIYYTVNGGAQVTSTITETIGIHETMDYTIPVNPYDFTNNLVNVNVPYTIKIWVDAVSNDRVRFNDTLSVTIESYGKYPMPITEDTVHVSYHNHGVLTATDAAGSTGIAHFWYTNSGYESWDLQYVGDPYVTPLVYYDTTYYVTSAPAVIYTPTGGTWNTTASNNIQPPFVFSNGFSRGKLLYKANELNASGKLTQISLYVSNAADGEQGIPLRLYAKNTSLTAFPSANPLNTWDSDIADATLIYDGNYFFDETGWVSFILPVPMDYDGNSILILTETYCGGSSCSAATGSANLKFNSSSISNCVLYKGANSEEAFNTGNYSTNSKRLVMKFQFVDAECQSEKVPIEIVADDVPQYDVEPVELIYPLATNCTLLDENIVVKVRNLINEPIPADVVEVKATFKVGSQSQTVSQIVGEGFAPNEEKEVTFTSTVNLSAPNNDVTYNYTIVTDLIGTPAYRGNDTIRGSILSRKTSSMPAEVIVEGEYLHTYAVYRNNPLLNASVTKWVYQGPTSGSSTTNNNNTPVLTTNVLYDTVVYFINGITPPANAQSCTTRTTRYQINVATPLHDISTDELISPVSFQCGVSNPHLQVQVNNTWYASDTIPANTFKLKAEFTGATPTSTSTSVEHTISQPIYRGAPTPITFGNTVTLGSSTHNNIYNYKIYSNPVNSSMYVYRANDTIMGSLFVPATPATPADIPSATAPAINAPYGGTATVTPTDTVFNQYYFYDQPTGGTALAQGTSFTTPTIMTDPTYFYYSGRILDPQFTADTTVGSASVDNSVLPFNFSKEHSVGIIMYTVEDLGFSEGLIDTISFFVPSSGVGSGQIPMKLYLKNDNVFKDANGNSTLTPQLVNQKYQNNWDSLTSGAMLIADDNFEFNQSGWYSFVIPGGFYYTGDNLLLLTEHHGGSGTLGYTAHKFRSTNVPSAKKRMVYYSTDNAFNPILGTGNTVMQQGSVRYNTKFNISYSCETADRGRITIHTAVPNIDLDVVSIVNPVTPNAAYTTNETVSVQLHNHGNNTANNYSLSYQLEGQTPVTVNNPVAVPSQGMVSYTFTTPVDLSEVYFPVDFKVYVTCSADQYPSNDTVVISLRKDICGAGSKNAVSPSISNVKFAGIDNLPLPAGWTPFGTADTVSYTDYTTSVAPAVLVKGQTYPISITNSFTGNSGVKLYKYVFIDFNRDGAIDYNNERVINITANNFNTSHPENATSEGLVHISPTALDGPTLMRVTAATATNLANTGCGYYDNGETEDYKVIIRGPFDDDLAVVGYLQPSGASCPDKQANIKVYVKNQGLNSQTFSQANQMLLTATVSGTASDVYTATVSHGTIAPGETQTFTIPNVALDIPGGYTVVTELTYTPDQHTVNNAWKTSFTIGNFPVDTIPILHTFDEAITDPDNPFPTFDSFELRGTTDASYKWGNYSGPTQSNPDLPMQDHTMTNNMNQYAAALGKSNHNSNTASGLLTTKCMDLHFRQGYPVQLDYWEFIYGTGSGSNAPSGTLLVQVGTGDDNTFVTVDSVVGPTQASSTSSWKNRVLMFRDNDEVARVRFRTFEHKRKMDICMDDINFMPGKPDIGVAAIVYPYDFRDTAGSCMLYGDSIHPIVDVVNDGLAQITSFEITGTLKVGNDVISFTESWTADIIDGVPQYFMPGDTIRHTFENAFRVFSTTAFCDFEARVYVPQDENPYNDNYTVHPCAANSIEDYVKEGGLVLNQNVPNPADDRTRISFLAPAAGKAVIEVFTLTGQKLLSEPINAQFGENYIDLNTSSYAAGMYIYTLQFEDAVLSKKMVIQK